MTQRVAGEGFGLVGRAAGAPDRAVHELVARSPEVAGDGDGVAVGVEFKHDPNGV